ncbi:MAG: terminase large subunit [Acetobacteraceae bacterium]
MTSWSTACPDWAERITAQPQRSLIPFDPLFPAEADAAEAIFRRLRIVKAPGAPTMGEACREWIFDLVRAVFGAYDPDTGRRLIRYFFMLVSKKNTKSTTAAGIMLTALIRNWRQSGEFYILAPTKEIADNSFGPAQDMVSADPLLKDLLRVQPNYRQITHRNTGAILKVIAADAETVSGKNTVGLFIDELWLFGKRTHAANMLQEAMGGLATNQEGFVIYGSTQSDAPPQGVFADKLAEFRDIRDGKIIDPRSLALIYEFPDRMLKDDSYLEPRNWYIPNPNLGASVDVEYLLDQEARNRRDGRAAHASFLAKHLNVQIGSSLRADGWAGALVWARGTDRTLTLETLLERCEVVTVGLDGGGLDDLLGIGVIGRERGTKRWLVWGHAMISDIGIERRKKNAEAYDRFEKQGDLTKFTYEAFAPGGVWVPRNILFVTNLVKRIMDAGLLYAVGVDRRGIGAIVDALAEIGVTQEAENLDVVPQGTVLMGAIKTVEIKLADHSLLHADQELMTWCVENAVVIPTATAMMIARDEAGYGKIDPLMAVFNAAHLMALNPEAQVGSMPTDYELPVWA